MVNSLAQFMSLILVLALSHLRDFEFDKLFEAANKLQGFFSVIAVMNILVDQNGRKDGDNPKKGLRDIFFQKNMR